MESADKNSTVSGATPNFRTYTDDDLDRLWISKLGARVGAYQQLAEDCFAALDRGWIENAKAGSMLAKTAMQAMRYAAEELGQLPQRVQATPSQVEVTYRIEGVNPEGVV